MGQGQQQHVSKFAACYMTSLGAFDKFLLPCALLSDIRIKCIDLTVATTKLGPNLWRLEAGVLAGLL